MNRRNFLKKIISAATAVSVGGAVGVLEIPKPKAIQPAAKIYTQAQREAVLAKVLDTPEGREALAKAMTEPIKRSLEYQGIGRKLLMVDNLPENTLTRYERECKRAIHAMGGMMGVG